MDSLKLWVALSPEQLADLNQGKDVHPDAYSGRFGLRAGPLEAVTRAQYLMDEPRGNEGGDPPKRLRSDGV